MMEIRVLQKEDETLIDSAVELLQEAFAPNWDCGREDVLECLEEGKVCLVAVKDGVAAGIAGAMPQYGVTGWELHPLAVRKELRGKEIGTTLIQKLECILREKGCVTIYLGSDDEDHKTTLSDTNLFEDTFEKIKNIQNKKKHAYEFYEKMGYQIIGVIPDANGLGKPDIFMAKSLVRN